MNEGADISQRRTTPGGSFSGIGDALEKSNGTSPGRSTTFEMLVRSPGNDSSRSSASSPMPPAFGSRRNRHDELRFSNVCRRTPRRAAREHDAHREPLVARERRLRGEARAVEELPAAHALPRGAYWTASGSSDLCVRT